MGNIDTAKANRGKGSHLFGPRGGTNENRNRARVVVRRLKHTPNLPMPYVFSEATENKEVRHIYWEPGKKRAHSQVAERGKVIELFMPCSSSSSPRTGSSSTCRFSSQLLNRFSLWDLYRNRPTSTAAFSEDVFRKSQGRTLLNPVRRTRPLGPPPPV